MNIELSFFDLLIIIGMVTGIVCSILLFNKSNKKPSNKLLGLGILAFVWLNTKTLLHALNLWEIHGIGFFPNSVELALPPLFYFYLKYLIEPKIKFTKKEWLYFTPFFLAQTFAIIVYVATMQTKLLAEKEIIASTFYFNEMKTLEEYLTVLSSVFYLSFGYQYIRNYKNWFVKNTSDTQFSELTFLRNVFVGLLFISFYTITNLILSKLLDAYYPWRWQLGHLMIATLVYYMGLVGYKNADFVLQYPASKPLLKAEKNNETVDLEIIAILNQVIETKKVHLNPKLNLQELADILHVNETILSNTINAYYKKNFRSFINEARVEEVKMRLRKEGLGKLSLLGLAKECGFNSEASFYRIFRSETGITPKQFLTSNTANSNS